MLEFTFLLLLDLELKYYFLLILVDFFLLRLMTLTSFNI